MEQHFILEIRERVEDLVDDDGFVLLEGSYETFRVSTRKIEAFTKDGLDFGAYGYVKRLIDECLADKKYSYASRKYSFGDCPDWYKALEPDADCQDPVKVLEVDVGR